MCTASPALKLFINDKEKVEIQKKLRHTRSLLRAAEEYLRKQILADMFKKPFKLKFQVQLKSTEKRKLSTDLKALFPALQDKDILSLLGSKETIVRTRVVAFNEEDVHIYSVNKVPFYFEVIDTDIKLPTIFMIWRFPSMLPCFTTSNSVLSRLKNGADLFFPGICKQSLLSHLDYKKKDPIYINLVDNKAAMAVGLSLVNKDDIINGNKNKDLGGVVKIYHTSGDFLFKMNSDAVVLELGPPEWALPVNEEPQTGKDSTTNRNAEKNQDIMELTEEINDFKLEPEETQVPIEGDNLELEKEKSNELLEYCFLKALKTIPKNTYPILPATFYANHVLTNLPEGENLHIKKTKWKKFSCFLQEKCLQGLIQLEKTGKNDFTISGANMDHNQLKEFVDPHKVVKVEPKSFNAPVVVQVFLVSAVTLPFFSKFGLKKNDELTRNDVRNYLNNYIKSEKLVHPQNPELVVLDPILNSILKYKEIISRANLLGEILESMRTQHKISTCGNTDMVYKCKLPLIEFETCLRTGNKKVTLISNLESYGVDVRSFSKELQHKAAASTTITPSVPGKKGPQVQVQGNQIANAVTILKEKYNINEKLMKGLEKAVKSKSKK